MSEDRNLEWVEYTRVNAEVTRAKERLLTELALSIVVNGQHFTTAMITPMMEKEFVTGYLFGQRIIQSFDDIESMTIANNAAEVTLSKNIPVLEVSEKLNPEIDTEFRVSKEDIYTGINAILKSEIYAETGGIHSAGLFIKGAVPVCITEDIGRHNALDKVIGYALINKVDFRQIFVASTGRLVSEMVSKICRTGIPIAATKAVVTKLGIEIGERCGLTIIGFVRDTGTRFTTDTEERIATERIMKIYTRPERIVC